MADEALTGICTGVHYSELGGQFQRVGWGFVGVWIGRHSPRRVRSGYTVCLQLQAAGGLVLEAACGSGGSHAVVALRTGDAQGAAGDEENSHLRRQHRR